MVFKYVVSGCPDNISYPLPYPTWYVSLKPTIGNDFNYSNNSSLLPYRLPFDWTKSTSYFTLFIFQTFSFFSTVRSSLAVFLVLYGFCQILIAFTEDLTIEINEFKHFVETGHKPFTKEFCSQIERKLCNIVQFHADTKRLVKNEKFMTWKKLVETILVCSFRLAMEFGDIYNTIVFAFLVHIAIVTTIALLEIQVVRSWSWISIVDCRRINFVSIHSNRQSTKIIGKLADAISFISP